MHARRFVLPRIRRGTLLACALIAVLLVPLALSVEAVPGVSAATRWLFFGVRCAIAVVLIAIWALLNVPPRKPTTGRVVVGVASFGEESPAGTREPRRSVSQLLRPRPSWEPTLSEDGETLLPLPDGGVELGDMLWHSLRKLAAPIPQVSIVRLPYIADERQAILEGDAANVDVVLWGTTAGPRRGEVCFAPQVTLTRRLEAPIPGSDLRLCGVNTIDMAILRLSVWQGRYVGVQQLWSLLLGIVFYAYDAHEEALNELAAVRVVAESGAGLSQAIAGAQLLSGNLHLINERWEAASAAWQGIVDERRYSGYPQGEAAINLGVLHALRGETVAALDQLTQATERHPYLAFAHHNLAVLQQRVDRQSEAEAHFRRAVELDPSLSESFRCLAGILQHQGNPAAARAALERALAVQSGDAAARRDLAALLIDQGELDTAQRELERALALDPQHATTFYLLGLLREQAGDHSGATEAWERAIALQPNYADAHTALARVLKQTGAAADLPAATPRPAVVMADAGSHMELGLAYLRQFRDAEAEREFRAALQKEPLYAPAHLQLGRVLRRRGQPAEALSALKAALQIDPRELAIYHELAELRAESGELERAAQTLEQAARIAPDDAQTMYLLGNIRASQARESGSRATLDHAIAAYRRATTIDPSMAAAHFNLAIAALTDGDVAGAVDALRRTISLSPDDGEAHRLLATVYHDLGRSREAVQLMSRAAELLPSHVPTLLQLAQLYRQGGQLDDAIATLRQAHKADKDNPRVLRELGGLYVSAQQFERAMSAFSRAKDLAPEQADSYLGLGVALKALGRMREAADAFGAAHQRKPDDAATVTQLAETLYAAGEAREAVAVLQRAVSTRRADAQLFYALGQMYGALGQPDRANEAYRMYAELRAAHA